MYDDRLEVEPFRMCSTWLSRDNTGIWETEGFTRTGGQAAKGGRETSQVSRRPFGLCPSSLALPGAVRHLNEPCSDGSESPIFR